MKKLYFLILFIFFFFGYKISAQQIIRVIADSTILFGEITDGDTMIYSYIDEVYIFPEIKFKNSWQAWRYRRLVYNVKKAYPWAKLAGKKFDEVGAKLETIQTEKQRKKYMKQVEKEIKNEFEDDLKKLTISQGRILIKLIDKEIGETSYDLLKEYRGSFRAFFWQAIARLFGTNLKSRWDPDGKDKLINEIVIRIEAGVL